MALKDWPLSVSHGWLERWWHHELCKHFLIFWSHWLQFSFAILLLGNLPLMFKLSFIYSPLTLKLTQFLMSLLNHFLKPFFRTGRSSQCKHKLLETLRAIFIAELIREQLRLNKTWVQSSLSLNVLSLSLYLLVSPESPLSRLEGIITTSLNAFEYLRSTLITLMYLPLFSYTISLTTTHTFSLSHSHVVFGLHLFPSRLLSHNKLYDLSYLWTQANIILIHLCLSVCLVSTITDSFSLLHLFALF